MAAEIPKCPECGGELVEGAATFVGGQMGIRLVYPHKAKACKDCGLLRYYCDPEELREQFRLSQNSS